MSDPEIEQEYLVKVDEEVYGPITEKRLIADLGKGLLSKDARFWDGEDWLPIGFLLENNVWNEDDWGEPKELFIDGPPLPASLAWKDVKVKDRWLMIYGDHLVLEGGGFRKEEISSLLTGEPREGGIPIVKILNVSITKYEDYSKVEISSFHKMYEVYTLVCNLNILDTESLIKELTNSDVRISYS
ncbi:MAG: hypothetical protein BEU00_01345 [Marine Group III euryarchaeote CG-Epi3]|uniref:GYF domain-containing protein n=1 Tax=Marine Group III euryarchaeote CG-Epi3 TaxID=1888997 RepID=A0A1J5TRY5_9ARCH|nr:MAG: hypothetical protein BEU00_01345 [Marine Group III euryarchaeote CG-Epi3]